VAVAEVASGDEQADCKEKHGETPHGVIGETVGIWSVGNAMGEIRSGIADLSVEKKPSSLESARGNSSFRSDARTMRKGTAKRGGFEGPFRRGRTQNFVDFG
jgi:hypothetical protein